MSSSRGVTNHDLAAKDLEIFKLKDLVRNVEAEWAAKHDSLQRQLDELLAKYTQKQDELEFAQEEVKGVREEHAEYEEIIRRGNGLMISDAVAEVDAMRVRLNDVEERYRRTAWEYSDQVSALQEMMKLYKLVQRRRPKVGRFLKSIPVPCMSLNEPSSTSAPGSHDYENFERQLSAVGRGGITRGQQVPNIPARGRVVGNCGARTGVRTLSQSGSGASSSRSRGATGSNRPIHRVERRWLSYGDLIRSRARPS